jgi:hypothetical protein
MCVAVAACSRGKPAPAPAPISAFDAAVSAAGKRVDDGDYSGADRILADYALKTKGTQDAAEISFFRALYMIDPKNKASSMDAGVRALNIYLNSAGARRYRTEAEILKRTAQTVQSLRTVTQGPKVIGRDTVYVTREDEIAVLKDQLAKANAELERIKKRLANPGKLNDLP